MSEERPFVPKTPVDFQKLKLDRLMANPDKPVLIPEMPKGKKGINVPEFVRNVMGSSAGAGSGEFHVYRHLRRKEYTRQKVIEEKAEREKLDDEFQRKLEENERKREEKIAKNRAKRLKQKLRRKCQIKKPKTNVEKEDESSSGSDSSDEETHSEQSPSNDTSVNETRDESDVIESKTNDQEKDKSTSGSDSSEEQMDNEQVSKIDPPVKSHDENEAKEHST